MKKAVKVCGMNIIGSHRVGEILSEYMIGGIAKSRSIGLGWLVGGIKMYCLENGLSFEYVMKLGRSTFAWATSRECGKCRAKITPDDYSEEGGFCVCCKKQGD